MASGFDIANAGVKRPVSGDKGGNSERPVSGSAGVTAASGGPNENSNGRSSDPNSQYVPKRKGRPPLPRDANGNIIRDGSAAPERATNKSAGKAQKLDLDGFTPNDKNKLANSVQALHALAATLTNQPVFALSNEESINLSRAVCDVLDYHKISLEANAGPWGLYMSLAVVCYMTYAPRIKAVSKPKQKAPPMGIVERATMPTSKTERKVDNVQPINYAGDIGPIN